MSTPAQLAYAAKYREANREKLRAYRREHYRRNRERVLAEQRAAAHERDIKRLHKTPRCMICFGPLTLEQVRRGVTCGVKCAQTRYSWFVRPSLRAQREKGREATRRWRERAA
jgi:hypothetical protein